MFSRLSRIRTPRATWVAIGLIAVFMAAYGVFAIVSGAPFAPEPLTVSTGLNFLHLSFGG